MKDKYKGYCHEGADPSIVINNSRELSAKQTLQVLENMLKYVEDGGRLTADDCNEMGNKHTSCSWGRCTANKDVYNDPHMHTFPQDFDETGRMSPIDWYKKFPCPFDSRDKPEEFGCFYHCKIFTIRGGIPTREQAVKIYKSAIKKFSSQLFSKEEDYWLTDPLYPVEDWKYEVANGDTLEGYWPWRSTKMEIAEEEGDGESTD